MCCPINLTLLCNSISVSVTQDPNGLVTQGEEPWPAECSGVARGQELFLVTANQARAREVWTQLGCWPWERKLVPNQSGPAHPADLTFNSDFFSKALAMTLAASTPTVLPSRRRASKPSKSSISLITSLAAQDQRTELQTFGVTSSEAGESLTTILSLTTPTAMRQALAYQGDAHRLTVQQGHSDKGNFSVMSVQTRHIQKMWGPGKERLAV